MRVFFVTWFSLLPCRRLGAELPPGRQRSHREAALASTLLVDEVDQSGFFVLIVELPWLEVAGDLKRMRSGKGPFGPFPG